MCFLDFRSARYVFLLTEMFRQTDDFLTIIIFSPTILNYPLPIVLGINRIIYPLLHDSPRVYAPPVRLLDLFLSLTYNFTTKGKWKGIFVAAFVMHFVFDIYGSLVRCFCFFPFHLQIELTAVSVTRKNMSQSIVNGRSSFRAKICPQHPDFCIKR